MANLLQVVMVETILSLHARRWSVRRIARELGIDRETVARHIRLSASDSKPAKAPLGSDPSDSDSKPAKAPIGSDEGAGDSKPANAPINSGAVEGTDLTAAAVGDPGPALVPPNVDPDADAASTVGRFSDCAPWRDVIQSMLALGLSAQRIFQDLVADHGFTGSYYSVRRFVSRLGAKLELPFRRMECGPGEEAQVDFGTGAPVLQPDGTRRRTHVFRIVLSHDEALGGEEKIMARYLKPDVLIIDDMGMKQLPKRSGEYLFEIVMRRYETRSTIMTSNRPLEDWGKLIGDVPSATAILDRFLHHAEIVTITGRSYRLRNQATKGQEPAEAPGSESDNTDAGDSKPAKAPTGSGRSRTGSKPAKAPTGSEEGSGNSKPTKAPTGSDEDPNPESDR